MEIIETTHEEYGKNIAAYYHVFNTPAFNHLNRSKCEEVSYLLFKDSKVRLGIILGKRNNALLSPFSAPFGGYSFVKEDVGIAEIEQAVDLLEGYAKGKGISEIRISLPPLLYAESFLAKLLNVHYRKGYRQSNLDLDFFMNLSFMDDYPSHIWRNARKNLNAANAAGLEFKQCSGADEIREVYDIISENRAFKQKPMNLGYDDILKTAAVIPTDYFLVLKENKAVASAIVFHATDVVIYVPLWGDRPGFLDLRPMNFLSSNVFMHYKNSGKNVVHIGISTESSEPNYGLCEFKESIGCTITPKFTLQKQL